jgi:phage replication O-like protein O
MASPQTENGYTKIANELLDQLVATHLPAREKDMLLFIIRKTYGYNKKSDRISLTQFEKALKVSRPIISKALKNLINRKMVVRTPLLDITFEKDWEKWVVDTPLLVKNLNHLGNHALTKTGNHALTHKRKKEITKESIPKGIPQAVQEKLDLIEYLRTKLGLDKLDGSQKWNMIYLKHLLNRMDNKPERVKRFIDYALLDPFDSQRATNFKYLYNNLGRIALKAKGQSESIAKI